MRAYILILVLTATTTAKAATIAYLPAADKTYQFVPLHVDWESARLYAQNQVRHGAPGELLTLHSAVEQEFVFETFAHLNLHAVWLGFTVKEEFGGGGLGPIGEGNPDDWVWINGAPVTFTDWIKAADGYPYDEPNNHAVGEDVAELLFPNGSLPGGWNDIPTYYVDSNSRYLIVQYAGNVVVPEPQTLLILIAGLLVISMRHSTATKRTVAE